MFDTFYRTLPQNNIYYPKVFLAHAEEVYIRGEVMQLLKPTEVAKILSLSKEALRKMRQRNVGPPWIKLDTGTIRYERRDLINWINNQKENTP